MYHIPGYCGYIPHVYAGNMFGKTYGVITNIAGQKSRDKEKHTNEYYESKFSKGSGDNLQPDPNYMDEMLEQRAKV